MGHKAKRVISQLLLFMMITFSLSACGQQNPVILNLPGDPKTTQKLEPTIKATDNDSPKPSTKSESNKTILLYSIDGDFFKGLITEIPYYQNGKVVFLTKEQADQYQQGHQSWLGSPIDAATGLCSNFISGFPFYKDDIISSNADELKTKDGFDIKTVSETNDSYVVSILTPDIGSFDVTMQSPEGTTILFITKIEHQLKSSACQ